MKVVALCGSLRAGSFNRMLLTAMAERAPEGVDVELADLRGIPVYDGDVEVAEGLPGAVLALQDRIAAADALLIGSPEYNGGIPGTLKNGIDWCSRGDGLQRVFPGKPTGLVGATPGGAGTRHAQQAFLQVFRVLGVWVYPGPCYLDHAAKWFVEGRLVDDAMGARCERYMAGLVDFAKVAAAGRRG